MVKIADEKNQLTELEKARALGRAEAVVTISWMFETCFDDAEKNPNFNQNELKTAKKILHAVLKCCPKALGIELHSVVAIGESVFPQIYINVPLFKESLSKINSINVEEIGK